MKLPARSSKPGVAKDISFATRFLWTRITHFLLQVNTPKAEGGHHSRVILSIGRGTSIPLKMELTALTLAELAAFRQTVLIATEAAEPIVRALDSRAQEELENGDDSDPRCYRPLPTVVIRKGALREYNEGLLNGRENVLHGAKLNVMSGGGPAPTGVELDEQSAQLEDGGEVGP